MTTTQTDARLAEWQRYAAAQERNRRNAEAAREGVAAERTKVMGS